LLDAEERKLGKTYTKKFRTTGEDRQQILLSDWKLHSPNAGTKELLKLEFPKALDRGSLTRLLTVVDAKGKPVAGKIELGKAERSWLFQPAKAWKNAEYRVKVDGKFEDVAGNTPLRPFDRDLKAPAPKIQPLLLPFRPVTKIPAAQLKGAPYSPDGIRSFSLTGPQ